jgi:hypothetical protein
VVSNPDVPTTACTPWLRHTARLAITTSGVVNSTTTSASPTTVGSDEITTPATVDPG